MNRELLIDRVVKHYTERKFWREDTGTFALTVFGSNESPSIIAEVGCFDKPVYWSKIIARVLPRSCWSSEKLRLHVEKMLRRCDAKVALHAVSTLE